MKTRKLAIAMLISASVVLTSTSSASAAMAAARPEQTLAVTRIDLNARNIVNPQHMIAEDPWDGKETVWIPIRDFCEKDRISDHVERHRFDAHAVSCELDIQFSAWQSRSGAGSYTQKRNANQPSQ